MRSNPNSAKKGDIQHSNPNSAKKGDIQHSNPNFATRKIKEKRKRDKKRCNPNNYFNLIYVQRNNGLNHSIGPLNFK